MLLDEKTSKVLLVDHKKSGLWLPAGGHVDIGEHPKETVHRECQEELGIKANFWCDEPFFLTSTLTVGRTARHTDVSLWYILKGDSKEIYNFEEREFNGIRWYFFDELPYEKTDPHMERFIGKLNKQLSFGV